MMEDTNPDDYKLSIYGHPVLVKSHHKLKLAEKNASIAVLKARLAKAEHIILQLTIKPKEG